MVFVWIELCSCVDIRPCIGRLHYYSAVMRSQCCGNKALKQGSGESEWKKAKVRCSCTGTDSVAAVLAIRPLVLLLALMLLDWRWPCLWRCVFASSEVHQASSCPRVFCGPATLKMDCGHAWRNIIINAQDAGFRSSFNYVFLKRQRHWGKKNKNKILLF